ncbi:DNA polymerase I [bacterium]|nr:DNA polymerase I [bacterium]
MKKTNNDQKLFLIDGSALAYRSHFSFISNPLKNSEGMETSAVFGFTNTLLNLLKKENPSHIAVIFDGPKKTFRHEMYKEYKATREKMPDELKIQLPYIRKIVEEMNIPYLVMDGFEADDIIGTLAKQSAKEGIHAYMVSGDKDFMQLLEDNISMYTMKKGTVDIVGVEGPVKKWGVKPEQVIDFMALMGDSSDNIPGVPGIGPKTALKLIEQFEHLQGIYKNLDQVKPEKLQVKLSENKDHAFLSQELVTIKTDVPVDTSFEELSISPFNKPELESIFDELDFHSLKRFLNPKSDNSKKSEHKNTSTTPSSAKKTSQEEGHALEVQGNYTCIESQQQLDDLIKTLKKQKLFALDTETTGLNPIEAELVGISIAFKEQEAFFIPVHPGHLDFESTLKKLKPILEDPKIKKGGQNIKYDMHILSKYDIHVTGISFDTMLSSYVLASDQRQHGMDHIAQKYLGLEKIPTEALIGKGKKQISMDQVEIDKLAHYACEDADVTLRLYNYFDTQLQNNKKLNTLYQELEIPLLCVLQKMEAHGMLLDTKKLKSLSNKLSKRLIQLTEDIHQKAGESFNINSPKQMGPILFEKVKVQEGSGIKKLKKTKTGYATDHATLEKFSDHPLVALILEYRNLSKLMSTYIEALPKLIAQRTGRIHTSFNQTIASTGRLSSSDPNLQNIPIRSEYGKEIREAFIAPKDSCLISADYSQVELRMLAHLADDETLIKTFEQNLDVHTQTAATIFNKDPKEVDANLRSRAKAINFGVLYGMGPQRLSKETGVSLNEAKDFIASYFNSFSKIKDYLNAQIEFAKKHGYIETILGRQRPLPDIYSKNPMIKANAERIATNTPIQGSAADLIKKAMLDIDAELSRQKLKSKLVLQVHDELVLETLNEEIEAVKKLTQQCMENALKLKVPLKIDLGQGENWSQAH